MHQLRYHGVGTDTPFLGYNSKTSTPTFVGRHGAHSVINRIYVTMNADTPKQQKQSYDIIHHKRGLLVRIQGKFVPNRRGRPKHFPLPRHIQQYLQKVGAA